MRGADAESLVAGSSTLRLLLDAGATGGALSAHRVRLVEGAVGAGPHRHDRSTEMFYVLAGSVDLLAGDDVLTATAGDLVVVPAGAAHAFAASAGQDGELLVVITPGVERFDFFRGAVRGSPPDTAPYDIHVMPSEAWRHARTQTAP
jgi:quercetin dioxygenase-like cupin family protein